MALGARESTANSGSGECGAHSGNRDSRGAVTGISTDRQTGACGRRNQGGKAMSIPAWISAAMSLDQKTWVLPLWIWGLRLSARKA